MANHNDMGSEDFRETFTYVASQLEKVGLAYLHVVDGLAFGFHELGEPMKLSEFRQVFSGPIWAIAGTRKRRQRRQLKKTMQILSPSVDPISAILIWLHDFGMDGLWLPQKI